MHHAAENLFIMHRSLEKSPTKLTLTLTARCATQFRATMKIDCGLQLLTTINRAYQRIPKTHFLCRNLHGFIFPVSNFKAFLSFFFLEEELNSCRFLPGTIVRDWTELAGQPHPSQRDSVHSQQKLLQKNIPCQNLLS